MSILDEDLPIRGILRKVGDLYRRVVFRPWLAFEGNVTVEDDPEYLDPLSGRKVGRTKVIVGEGGEGAGLEADAVSNTYLANMATQRLKGRTTAGTGDPEDLTPTQATAMLDVATTSLKGLHSSADKARADHNAAVAASISHTAGTGLTTLTSTSARTQRLVVGPSAGDYEFALPTTVSTGWAFTFHVEIDSAFTGIVAFSQSGLTLDDYLFALDSGGDRRVCVEAYWDGSNWKLFPVVSSGEVDDLWSEVASVSSDADSLLVELNLHKAYARTQRKINAYSLVGAQSYVDVGAAFFDPSFTTFLINTVTMVEIRIVARKVRTVSGVPTTYARSGTFRATVTRDSGAALTIEHEASTGSSFWLVDPDATYPVTAKLIDVGDSTAKLQVLGSDETGIASLSASTLALAAYITTFRHLH